MRGSCPSRKLPCPMSSLISETPFPQKAQLLRPKVSERGLCSYKGLTKETGIDRGVRAGHFLLHQRGWTNGDRDGYR